MEQFKKWDPIYGHRETVALRSFEEFRMRREKKLQDRAARKGIEQLGNELYARDSSLAFDTTVLCNASSAWRGSGAYSGSSHQVTRDAGFGLLITTRCVRALWASASSATWLATSRFKPLVAWMTAVKLEAREGEHGRGP